MCLWSWIKNYKVWKCCIASTLFEMLSRIYRSRCDKFSWKSNIVKLSFQYTKFSKFILYLFCASGSMTVSFKHESNDIIYSHSKACDSVFSLTFIIIIINHLFAWKNSRQFLQNNLISYSAFASNFTILSLITDMRTTYGIWEYIKLNTNTVGISLYIKILKNIFLYKSAYIW